MKRDLELIRNMLLLIEANSNRLQLCDNDFLCLNSNRDVIDYHLYLLADSGYIDFSRLDVTGSNYPQFRVNYLTNTGCDYLDAVRSTSVWNKTKEALAEVGGQSSLAVIKVVAEHVALSLLGI